MSQNNLNRLFSPRHIAVVGASAKTGKIGNILLKNLMAAGYSGTLLPVNPKHAAICGLACLPSVSDLEMGVDLALIATPIESVVDIIGECVERKVGSAIIVSTGGKEIGEQGREVEEKIHQVARRGNLRIVGPNCMGIIRPGAHLNASLAAEMPSPGKLAFVSQSGAICSAILDLALKEHIGFSHFVSIGSMLDVNMGDMIDYLGNDPQVKSILLYMESLTNFRKFMSAARSVSRIKPIIVLKSGRSAAGARASSSHTGAMAGEDAVYDAAFRRAGIVRVDTIEELFDCAELMAKQPLPRGPKLAILTNSGGPGVMATDTLAHFGHEPAILDAATIHGLDTFLPVYWSRSNPIDILGDASAERFGKALEICLGAKGIDGILIILTPQVMTEPIAVAKMVVKAIKGHRHPIFACWMGGKAIWQSLQILNSAGIPTYETPERAVRAFLYMVEYSRGLELLLEIPPKRIPFMAFDQAKVQRLITALPLGGIASEMDSNAILAAYGFPMMSTKVASTEADAITIAREFGYPLVMKLSSPDITYKTDVGGVQIDLRCDTDVSQAYHHIMASAGKHQIDARIAGVTLQPYVARPDYEILLGARRDTNFGPVVLFGMGGIYTEVLHDRALGLPPLNRLLARRLMQETKAFTLLQGYRNRPNADLEQLEEMITRLSQLLIDFPEIAELDMNPVLIKDGKAVVVNSRILISPVSVASPLHLVIAPYPEGAESHIISRGGRRILVRPVKPEDAHLILELFNVLSSKTIYHRFFGHLKQLQPEMLIRFTQIDYDREVALVAIDEDAETDTMLGVARIIGDADGITGEFAVLVGDAWQGEGIGSKLLGNCLTIAEKQGFKTVFGIALLENRGMSALGKKLGFEIHHNLDSGEYELTIQLGDNPNRLYYSKSG